MQIFVRADKQISSRTSTNGEYSLVVIAGITILVPYHAVNSQQLIWGLGIRTWNLWVSYIKTNCTELISR